MDSYLEVLSLVSADLWYAAVFAMMHIHSVYSKMEYW